MCRASRSDVGIRVFFSVLRVDLLLVFEVFRVLLLVGLILVLKVLCVLRVAPREPTFEIIDPPLVQELFCVLLRVKCLGIGNLFWKTFLFFLFLWIIRLHLKGFEVPSRKVFRFKNHSFEPFSGVFFIILLQGSRYL